MPKPPFLSFPSESPTALITLMKQFRSMFPPSTPISRFIYHLSPFFSFFASFFLFSRSRLFIGHRRRCCRRRRLLIRLLYPAARLHFPSLRVSLCIILSQKHFFLFVLLYLPSLLSFLFCLLVCDEASTLFGLNPHPGSLTAAISGVTAATAAAPTGERETLGADSHFVTPSLFVFLFIGCRLTF